MPSPTVEAAEPSATPSPEEATAPTAAPTAAASTAGQKVHVVQPGENLFRIALRYGTTVDALARANGIANPSRIYVGQKIVVDGGMPAPQPPSGGTTYVVKPGDNLFRIALRYNMSYLYLAQYNGISNPSHVYVGQTLRIPAR
jgi:putative chitinase